MKLMNYRFFHLHTKKLCPRISRMPRPLNASLNSRSVYVYLYVSVSDLWYVHELSHHIRHSLLSSVPHSLSFIIIMLPATDSCEPPTPPISLSPLDASGAGRRSIVGARRLLFQSGYFLYIFPPDAICCFRLYCGHMQGTLKSGKSEKWAWVILTVPYLTLEIFQFRKKRVFF